MRKVLVLGGTGDIGAAIASELEARYSDDVLCVGKNLLDLSSPESIDYFLTTYGSNFDVVVHSAGYNNPGPFETLSEEDIRLSIEINLMGFLKIVKAVTPHWKTNAGGRLIVISSLYGFLSRRGRLPYALSKHALIGVVKTLAIELGAFGVTANAVSPGFVNTKMTSKNNNSETISRLVAGIPLGRLGTTSEIAKVVSFLASPDATYITGHDLVVDGGYSIGGFQG